jgi:lysophospholipase L1-like esterase
MEIPQSDTLQTIFFGANDACLPGSPSGQFVPLDEYCGYLKELATHPDVLAHDPHVMLVTPPPIDEYQLAIEAHTMGLSEPSRTAINTKRYADGCRQVARSLDIPVVDLWTAFMKEAGWEEGQPLPGSRDSEANETFQRLFHDGQSWILGFGCRLTHFQDYISIPTRTGSC